MIELSSNATLALAKITGLRRLGMDSPELLKKAEKKVLKNLNLEDLAAVAAVLNEQAGR